MTSEVALQATLEGLKEFVDVLVDEKLQQMLGDPDEGLELQDWVRAQLRKSLKSQSQGQRGVPLDEVLKQFGMDTQ